MPKHYSPEFRRKVLDLVKEGRPIAEVASDLWCDGPSIYIWRRQERTTADSPPAYPAPTTLSCGLLAAGLPNSRPSWPSPNEPMSC